MTLMLTDEKIYKLKNLCRNITCKEKISIRKLVKLIGNLAASFPAVTFGPLHLHTFKNDKN